MGKKLDTVRGALLGLAVGDAMGYTVDSRTLEEIREDYGPNGLMGYDLVNGYADITSYTQIAAFGINGLLLALTQRQKLGEVSPARYVAMATREWSRSQRYCKPERNYCWLSAVPEAKRRRCMDNRMLDALDRDCLGTMEEPTIRSNHPGALTLAVAVALLHEDLKLDREGLDRLGAELVAQTHGDPEAFISGAVLTHAMTEILINPDADSQTVLQNTMDAIQMIFGREYAQTTHIWELLQMAVTLANSEQIEQAEAMERLNCRTSAEVLAGALYACLTCHGSFDAAIITAVNHSGRSAAVGAVTGAILGAKQGQAALPEFYLESLESAAVLAELASDVAQGCPVGSGGFLFDGDWDRKYLNSGF